MNNNKNNEKEANGGIHEFTDRQFGRSFPKGPTRWQARKSLVPVLKEIEVRGMDDTSLWKELMIIRDSSK